MAETECSEIITSEQSMASPGYPNYYGQRKHCKWELFAAESTFLSINLTDLDLGIGIEVTSKPFYLDTVGLIIYYEENQVDGVQRMCTSWSYCGKSHDQ